MSRGSYSILVLAKAPAAGKVKTRLGVTIGDVQAAEVACAALLDTLETCTAAVGADRCHLALAGDLTGCVDEEAVREALSGWSVFRQRGDDFATRLAMAHEDSGPGPMVQIGMDTPHVTVALLDAVAQGLSDSDAVLGPAEDGGWWVLGRHDPGTAAPLASVEMSTTRTYDDTRAALVSVGHRVVATTPLVDVDTAEDADSVTAQIPGSRFAQAWRVARRAQTEE
ncbi:MAG: DUF2064 domain-containing protein [Nocardioides sp.]|nr:DUF2064 domain-containing protein [Nocardioides sp.]